MLRKTLCFPALAALGLMSATPSQAADRVKDGMTEGEPGLASAGPIIFSPEGVLFVGDAKSGAIFAFDVGEKAAPAAEPPGINDLGAKLAGLLGTTVSEVLVNDMAVHPKTRSVYLSLSRSRGADAQPAIARVRGEEIDILDLSNVSFSRADLANVPEQDAKDRRGRPLRRQAITDLKFYDGKLYVAGLSNEEFASSLRTLRYPFENGGTFSTVEIYHGAHGQYETHAPIRTMLPIELEGKPHLLASYTCTPLVTLPLESLEDGEHVKGKTVAELGFGNTPLDMVAVENGGKTFVYMVNNRRGGMKIDLADIVKAGSITTPVEDTFDGVPYIPIPMAGVLRLADFSSEAVVMLRRDIETGGLSLRSLSKRRL